MKIDILRVIIPLVDMVNNRRDLVLLQYYAEFKREFIK